MSKSKIKSYKSFLKTAYQGWFGEDDYRDGGYECLYCGAMLDAGERKCEGCGALHKMERANLKMIRPVLVQDGKEDPKPAVYETAPDLVGPAGKVNFTEPKSKPWSLFKFLFRIKQ